MLKHETKPGVQTLLVDDLGAEEIAMLQALYSRSAESAELHVERAKRSGASFMERYYVGYNHKSIADCAATTFFIEGVSLLAAKAIQDNPLYSGQETSTRYIDMSSRRIEDPYGTDLSGQVLRNWMRFYSEGLPRAEAEVRRRHPRRDGEDGKAYEGAVKARTFDVMRGFLPAGVTTQLSWHTNLRQASDHVGNRLRYHPLGEVRDIAGSIASLMGRRYPSTVESLGSAAVSGVSAGSSASKDERQAWNEAAHGGEYAYPSGLNHDSGNDFAAGAFDELEMFSTLNEDDLDKHRGLLSTRPRGCVLPHWVGDFGQLEFTFSIDFGSFRDLQRHRNGVCRMPLLDPHERADGGIAWFEPWYLDQLDRDHRAIAREFLDDQIRLLAGLPGESGDPERSYYAPLGTLVPAQVTYSLPAALYVVEMRSARTVHPTLRARALEMGRKIRRECPAVAVHLDEREDDWTIRRGTQTIEAR